MKNKVKKMWEVLKSAFLEDNWEAMFNKDNEVIGFISKNRFEGSGNQFEEIYDKDDELIALIKKKEGSR